MPLFDYQCEKCGSVIEKLVKSSSDKETVWCPKCDYPMHRQLPLTSFDLKGTGWYKTDFKTKK